MPSAGPHLPALTSSAPGFMRVRKSASTMWRVSGVSGSSTTTTSAPGSSSGRSTRAPHPQPGGQMICPGNPGTFPGMSWHLQLYLNSVLDVLLTGGKEAMPSSSLRMSHARWCGLYQT